MCTGNDDIALTECAVGNEYRRDVAPPFVERALDYGAHGAAFGIGFQIEHVGFEQNFLE